MLYIFYKSKHYTWLWRQACCKSDCNSDIKDLVESMSAVHAQWWHHTVIYSLGTMTIKSQIGIWNATLLLCMKSPLFWYSHCMIVYSLTTVDHRLQTQETNKCHSSIVVNKFSEVPENRIILIRSIVYIHDDPFSCRIREISAKTHIVASPCLLIFLLKHLWHLFFFWW